MKPEEIIEKDWQLLTAYSEMATVACLETIMQNQAVIISELKKIPLEDVIKQINKNLSKNSLEVKNRVKNKIPKNSDRK